MATADPAETDPGAESTPRAGKDRRRSPRRRVLKSASIVFDAGRASMACYVLDISETGALIMPANVRFCPDHFVLKPLLGPERKCEVVWRRGAKIGIRYM